MERHKDEPFAILGINTDKDKDAFRRQLEQHGVTWRSSWQGSTSGPIPTGWGVHSYPTTFLLDAKRTIRVIGARGEELDREVEKLLAEMKPDDGH